MTGASTGHPVRTLRNKMTKKYLKLEGEGASFEELEQLTLGALRNAVLDGDVAEGSVMAGQISGMVHDVLSCEEIVKNVTADAERLLKL